VIPEFSILYHRRIAFLTAVLLLLPIAARSVNDPIERTFTEPRADVERAVATAKSSSSGKLPALEGFVGQIQRPAERYEKIYYQCIFQVIPSVTGETSVRVTAKITAWYDDPDKLKSGYEVLPSNGRLENDALDRVQQILEPASAAAIAENQPAKKYDLSMGSVLPRGALPAAKPRETRPPSVPATNSSSVSEEEIQELRNKRVAAERRAQQLNSALQNLQQLYDSQTKPANLVAIQKTGAPVYAHPEEVGKPLFVATEKDQFEMIEIRGEWVHVRISGESRGWIRKAQLQFLDDSAATAGPAGAAGIKSAEVFRIMREDSGTFPGNWEPLRGKSVKVYSVQPTRSPTLETTPREKRNFVKELFLQAWKEHATADHATVGVVVVFDSGDGGQAAATFASLQQWQQGNLSEAAFWQACSLDPTETFDLTGKKR
jgi:hypothetical protein